MLTGDTSELLVNGTAFNLIIITILLATVILILVWFCNKRMINTIVQGRSIESGGSLEDQPDQSPVSSSTQPSLADRRLMPNDLHQVYTEVYATRPKWNNIGLAFNLPPATLESIRIKHREDPDSCLREMLYTQLKLEHPLTWRDVVNGLRCSTVGETALANKLATKYGLEQNNSPELETPQQGLTISVGEPSFVLGHTLPAPECVVRYSSYLKDRYKQMSVLPDPDWPPAITTEQHYTNLALIERERHGLPRTDTSETMAYDYAHGKIDNIVAGKQKIKLKEAFLPIIGPGSKESRLSILMDGAPGVGKTTISRKVCIDWANGELLHEYQLVILVPLREVILAQAGHQSIADLLPADSNKLKDQVVQHIEEACGAKVLFIFDGFDELSSQQRNAQSLFLDIINGSKFHRCSVLVTSRPYASGSLRRINRVNRHVEVLGFAKKQIEDCIHKNVPIIKADQLIQKLKERLDIGSICYIPLNCRIVLFVYSQQKYKLPATLTQLYEVFILHTLKHHAKKITQDPTIIEEIQEASDIPNLPQSVQTQLDSLSEMAFSGIDKDQLVFNNEVLKTSTNVLSLGLLNAIETFTISGSRKLFQFLHLTIQEFLAARHIASSGMSAVEKAVFMKSHINNERFRMTLLFLSGLTHLNFLPPGEPLLGGLTIDLSSRGNEKTKFVFLAQLFYESETSSSQWLLSSLSSIVLDSLQLIDSPSFTV